MAREQSFILFSFYFFRRNFFENTSANHEKWLSKLKLKGEEHELQGKSKKTIK